MARTADADLRARIPGLTAPEIVNGETLYQGAAVAIGSRDHATAASRGRAEAWASTAGQIPAGFQGDPSDLGDTSASPIPEAYVSTDACVLRVPVTGLAGTEDDRKRLVYMSDDGTFTLTRPAVGIPHGWIDRDIDGTFAWVEFFSARELALCAMAGAAKYTWFLGVIAPALTSSGNLLTGIEAPHHGRILSVYGIVVRKATDADVDIDINLEIGATNVTGGVIEWLNTDAVGAKKAGTAVTAENVFHEGDLIDVEGVVNAAGTAADPGLMGLYAEILCEPGL